jgi:hypothetical protein
MTFIKFERGRDGVVGPTLGPYEYVQITYNSLRLPNDVDLAYLNADGDWEIIDGGEFDGAHYSDVIISEVEGEK